MKDDELKIENLERNIKTNQEKLNNILVSNMSFNNRNKLISEIQEAIDNEKEELKNYKKSLERKKHYEKLFDIFITNDIICELQKDLGPIEEKYIESIEESTRYKIISEFSRMREEEDDFDLSIKYVEDLDEEQYKKILSNIKDYLLVDFLRVIKSLREEASRNNLKLDDSVPDENTWIGKTIKETLLNLFKGE